MGCAKCGGNSSTRCNLCNQTSNKFYPWGTSRHICWRCHDAMVAKVAEYKMQIDRITTLMKGKPWVRKNYDKKVKKNEDRST